MTKNNNQMFIWGAVALVVVAIIITVVVVVVKNKNKGNDFSPIENPMAPLFAPMGGETPTSTPTPIGGSMYDSPGPRSGDVSSPTMMQDDNNTMM